MSNVNILANIFLIISQDKFKQAKERRFNGRV